MAAWPVFEGTAPEVALTITTPCVVQSSDTQKRTVVRQGTQSLRRWELTYSFLRSSQGDITAFLSAIDTAKGRYTVWTFSCPISGQTYNVSLEDDSVTITQVVSGVCSATVALVQVL